MTEFIPKYNLICSVRLRKLFDIHKKFVDNEERILNSTEIKDSAYLFRKYLVTTESHISDILRNPGSSLKIQNEFDSFFEYAMLNLLKLYNLMMHINKENVDVKYDLRMFKEIYNYLEKENISDNPTITAYRYITLLNHTHDEKYYYPLKEVYFNNWEEINKEDRYMTHMYLFSFGADRYNRDADRKFIKETYELYKYAYEKGLYALGEMLYPDFANYVKIFARAGDTQLARKFTEELKDILDEENKENTINYCYSIINYAENDYTKSLRLIARVNFRMPIMKLQAKLLKLQLFYELGYFEDIRGDIDSLRHFLSREKMISPVYMSSVSDFCKQFLELVEISESSRAPDYKGKLAELSNGISQMKGNHFGVKLWLEHKVNTLMS